MTRIAATAPRLKSLKVRERDVQRAVIDYMRAKGFRVLRMHSGLFSSAGGATRVGEPGMPDLLCLRYRDKRIMWIETKAPGGTLRTEQWQWMRGESACGAEIHVVSDVEQLRGIDGL